MVITVAVLVVADEEAACDQRTFKQLLEELSSELELPTIPTGKNLTACPYSL